MSDYTPRHARITSDESIDLTNRLAALGELPDGKYEYQSYADPESYIVGYRVHGEWCMDSDGKYPVEIPPAADGTFTLLEPVDTDALAELAMYRSGEIITTPDGETLTACTRGEWEAAHGAGVARLNGVTASTSSAYYADPKWLARYRAEAAVPDGIYKLTSENLVYRINGRFCMTTGHLRPLDRSVTIGAVRVVDLPDGIVTRKENR